MAAYCGKPESTVCACNCVTIVEMHGLGMLSLNLTGFMRIVSTGADKVDDFCTTRQRVDAFEVRGTHPILGEMHVTLNDTISEVAPTTMVNLIPGRRFPARHDVYVNARMTLGSMPGSVLASKPETAFHMTGDITSYPAINESYFLVERVEFEDASSPGTVVATAWTSKILVG